MSRSESESFAAYVGRGPIQIVRNGSLELAVPEDVAPDPDHVLSVGRLERYKGHQLAITALPELVRLRPEAHLTILGTGPYEQELRALADDTGVGERVVISSVPPSDRSGMARAMAGAGVVTLLSDYEAHPVVIMEALSLRRPVVGRANSGVIELIEDGLVLGVPDTAEPAAIAAAWNEAANRPAMQAPTLPSWDECADAVEGIYRKVLDA